VKQKSILFGQNQSLFGILCQPDVTAATGIPVVIFLNSGLLHRVGPNRLYVNLARTLAAAGFTSLRFDLSGIGDSPHLHSLPPEKSAIIDTQQAMDMVTRENNAKSFVLMGICSGADYAFHTACHDKRVAAVAMIDGFAFASSGYVLSSYLKLIFNAKSWKRLAAGKSELLRLLAAKLSRRNSPETEQIDPYWPAPDLRNVKSGMQDFAKRGINLCLIYSAGGASLYNFRKTYAPLIKPLLKQDLAQIKIIESADHLFTPVKVQEALANITRVWCGQIKSVTHSRI
jgi:dienelactone hydrolase